MERRSSAINNCSNNGGFTYSDLFNLESLMNFQLPHQDDEFGSCGSGSQAESRSSPGVGNMLDHMNGFVEDKSVHSGMARRGRVVSDAESASISSFGEEPDSNDEDHGAFSKHISEDQYRSMLGEHIKRYHRMRYREPALKPEAAQTMMPVPKQNHLKLWKSGNESFISAKEERAIADVGNSPHYYEDPTEYGAGSRLASSLDNPYLDIGKGITYCIPPTYENLVTSLGLPSFSDIQVEEKHLKSKLDLQSLAAIVAIDRKYQVRSECGMGEPLPQYDSLQTRLKALSGCSSAQKFSLQVCDIGLDSLAIPEGAAGKIQRSILSESGSLQVYFVKVLEKGDTYEIIERSLPKKQKIEKDPSLIEKEEMEKIGKVWVNIVRRDIPKYHRIFTNLHRRHITDAKRCSEMCQREVKLKVSRSLRYMKQASSRTRRLVRDALMFWKRIDKEQAELRKKEEKEAAEALKREEELRESKRQQQRLNFLISQTELYSHFMQNKPTPQPLESFIQSDMDSKSSEIPSVSAGTQEDVEDEELKREALRAAQNAVSQQKKLTNAFDSECLKLRQVTESEGSTNEPLVMGSSKIDLLNPSTMPITSSVQTPEMFKGTLKEYQLKGLQWLVNCYEQGLNGILADEMGLGKTIQAMAFLAHLAEEKNIWGPFLVVAPSSVLNNWVDEVNRFCPNLKTLPYWGGAQERNVLRKNINPKRLYRRESAFHILITSYQLLVYDEKCLRRVKWQYMVLDEAQAIKSSTSIRWKTLLSFNCRNRLLLTGTPIQNNMAELWALLHFIMPTLFDSHEQFNEWFSKGIENHAEHGGTLNEHQLSRLHAVLKPFMLRRVKKDVISEMTAKTEVTVHCKLSSRQQAFYQAIKNKISLSELIDVSRGYLNEKKFLNLMNIVIQLRKVCNHPELFERNEGSSYAYFAKIPNSLLSPPFGELEVIHYPGGWNPISYKLPKLVYQSLVQRDEFSHSVFNCGVSSIFLEKLFDIYLPENIYQSSLPRDKELGGSVLKSGAFCFTRLIDLSPAEFYFLIKGSILERLLFSLVKWNRQLLDEVLDIFLDLEGDAFEYDKLEKGKVKAVSRMLLLPTKSDSHLLRSKHATGPWYAPFEPLVNSQHDRFISNTRLLRSIYAFIPRVRAPPINIQCYDSFFPHQEVEEFHNPWIKRLLLGFARTSELSGPLMPSGPHHLIEEIDSQLAVAQPIFQLPYLIFGSSPPMQNFDLAKMLTESGKLQMLDILLKRLRADNHRVLLFAQMTKMLDILEDYMNYRKYKYLRLDGSSSIGDRRDMVWDFQHRNDIFVFLLSTRAGGLGINLTAADTVIFYESDWNPTLDLQAMDRAHRLGQTKEVTVYRLICKETVEEKILQRASQKNTVQQLVMTGGHVQGDLLKSEDVVSLLIDDTQLEQKLRETPVQHKDRPKKRPTKGIRVTADGDATLENLDQDGSRYDDSVSGLEKGATTNKKRKSNSKTQASSNSRNKSKPSRITGSPIEKEIRSFELEEDGSNNQHTSKRAKNKNDNESLETKFRFASNPSEEVLDHRPTMHDPGLQYEAGVEVGYSSQSPPLSGLMETGGPLR